MASSDTPVSAQWRVINVVPGQGPDATGRYVQGKTVTYQLKSGQAGTVFVPSGSDTPDAVKAAIGAEAANLAAILNLTSDS